MNIIEQILYKIEKEENPYVQYALILELSKNQDDLLKLVKLLFYYTDKNQSVIRRSVLFAFKILDEAQLTLFTVDVVNHLEKEDAPEYLTEISIQFPHLIHQYFEVIFEKDVAAVTFGLFNLKIEENKSPKFILFLKSVLDDDNNKDRQRAAYGYILLTKSMDLIEYAIKVVREKIDFFSIMDHKIDREKAIEQHLNDVGFYLENGKLKNFTAKNTYYIQFPKEYRGVEFYSHDYPLNDLDALPQEYQFGGTIINTEQEQLNHIITLDSILKEINIFSLKKLVLAVDFNFLWYKIIDGTGLFYQHDDSGVPVMISDRSLSKEGEEDTFYRTPMKTMFVRLALSPKRWECFNDCESINQFGGTPKWIQQAELMVCPKCNKKMQFLMQLGNTLRDEKDNEVIFGNYGSCYAFWCDTDRVSGYSWQCT